MLFWFVIVSLAIHLSVGQDELLTNPNFENDFDGNWRCTSCLLERSTDAYEGQYSAKISERTEKWASVTQNVNVRAGAMYYFRIRIKLLNQFLTHQFHSTSVMMAVEYADGEKQYKTFGTNPHLELAHGWQIHGGDVTIKNKVVVSARVYIQFEEIAVNYLVDQATFTEIIPNLNWKEEANARIEQIRKADLTFALNLGASYKPQDVELNVRLTRHAVPFGSVIDANRFVDDTVPQYKQFFLDNFEYSVLENSLKWKIMERIEGVIDFDRPNNAITELQRHGIPVRGHCVYWEVEKNVPDWLKSMAAEEVRSQISRRAQYVVQAFKGRLVHWDVNNEDLHGSFFKSATDDTTIINTMFRETHKHDTDAKLFLNDFNAVSQSQITHAYLNQAIRTKNAGVSLYGIGVQSHISGYLNPDLLKKRIEVLAEAGLPIWITELDYPNEDRSLRADGYEVALRLYYSMPQIEGILLWGFWDQRHWKPEAALVEGDDFIINEAGLRYQQLVKTEWNTTATLRPTSSNQELNLRGFQGIYTVDVRHKGATVKLLTFDVPNKTSSKRIEISI